MGKNYFDQPTDLDRDFLEAVYENDRETAVSIFQQYLHDLPADLIILSESFKSGNRQEFVSLIHKKKVGFSYVGLTEITSRLSDLESKCSSPSADIKQHKAEFDAVVDRMRSTTGSVRDMLIHLQQQASI